MLPEHKLVQQLYHILLVLRVVTIKCFNQFGFNQALLIKPFLVLQNFQRDKLFLLVIEGSNDDAETALTQLFDDFVPVCNMIVIADKVLLLLSVKPMVCFLVEAAPSCTAWLLL